YKCVARGSAPDGEFPSDPAPLAVHPPSECSGVKVLRNTSSAKAARLPPLPFRPPDPFRALREPDRSRRDREAALPAPNKRERSCGHGGDLREKPVDTKSSIQVRVLPDDIPDGRTDVGRRQPTGLTSDISPLSTLISCGSSSTFHMRRT